MIRSLDTDQSELDPNAKECDEPYFYLERIKFDDTDQYRSMKPKQLISLD